MRKGISAGIVIVITVAGGFLVEPQFPLGDIRWFHVMIVGGVVLILLYSPEIISFLRALWTKRAPTFDMPIRDGRDRPR